MMTSNLHGPENKRYVTAESNDDIIEHTQRKAPLGIMKIGGILCGCGKIRCAKIGCEISCKIESWKNFIFINCKNFSVAGVQIRRTISLQVRKLDVQINCRFESC